jgi:hypothetical protein
MTKRKRVVTGAQVRAVAKAAAARPVEMQTLLFGSYKCTHRRCRDDAYYDVRYSDESHQTLCLAHAPLSRGIPQTMQRSPHATRMRSFRIPDSVYAHLMAVAAERNTDGTKLVVALISSLTRKDS